MTHAPAPLTPEETRRWSHVGMLAALALLLSYAETFVPIPLPGVKLGLANVAVLVALAQHDAAGATCVALIKVLASGLLFGSPLTMAYSLVGTALSLAGMVPLSRLRTMRLTMLSVVGALLHETGQLLVAQIVMGTAVVWYTAPVLLVAGVATGALCGTVATGLASAIPPGAQPCQRGQSRTGSATPRRWGQSPLAGPDVGPATRLSRAALAGLVLLVAFAVVVLRAQSLPVLAACAAGALAACAVARVRPRSLVRALGPLATVAVLTLTLQLVASPHTAARETARAVLRLASLAAASTAFVRLVPTGDLTATVAWLVSPLTRRGVRTEGFVLAFGVAVELVPTLADLARRHVAEKGGRLGLADLRTLVPDLVRELYE